MHLRPALLFLAALAAVRALDAAPDDASSTLSLDTVLAAVRERHPALAAGRTAAEAMRARVDAERAWEDPMVAGNFVRNDQRELLSHSEFELEIAQALPLSGNNRRRARVAEAEAAEARTAVSQTELELVSQARRAFVDLATAQARLGVLRRTEEVLTQLADDLRAKYAAGQRGQSEVFAVEVEQVMLKQEIATLEGRSAALRAQLNTLMSQPVDTSLPPLPALALAASDRALADYVAAARLRHPELSMADASLATAEARIDVARGARRPDPELRLMLKRMNGSSRVVDGYDTGVAVRVPWFNGRKYRAMEREARTARAAAEEARAASEQTVLGRVAEQWHLLEAARQNARLAREQTLPLAQQQLAAAQRDFAVGRIPLGELLDAHRNVFRVEAEVYASLGDYHLMLADLDEAAGLVPSP
ncbi:MAG TPA: TolC family protein [Opitutaceae bacterium]